MERIGPVRRNNLFGWESRLRCFDVNVRVSTVIEEQHQRKLPRSHILSKKPRQDTNTPGRNFGYDSFIASVIEVHIAIILAIMIEVMKQSKLFAQIKLPRLDPMEVS